ncbi:response regulator [Anditalea andensis]|uniref:Response regulatory domain-containing protein n=1 Tax=Anditalea andensis TaxID=1048983 RepID=A0A074L0N7_9BACT|nr:response regulator [Anditalea andensis]KEO75796.1 hypothetical protein EL17_22485 [Anditalea andensis]
MVDNNSFKLSEQSLNAVKGYDILDSLSEKEYDDITFLAAMICGTPISLITILDERRQFFKSNHGIDIKETIIDHSFCMHTIQHKEPFVVQDARIDDRFNDNPLVTGYPHVVFYAGISLVSSDNAPIGALCVKDIEPRSLNTSQIDALKKLSRQVQRLLELRRKNNILEQTRKLIRHQSILMEDFANITGKNLISTLNKLQTYFNNKDEINVNLPIDGPFYQNLKGALDEINLTLDQVLAYAHTEISPSVYAKIDFKNLINDIFLHLGTGVSHKSIHIEIKEYADIYLPAALLKKVFSILLMQSTMHLRETVHPKISIDVEEKNNFYHFILKDKGTVALNIPGDTPINPFKHSPISSNSRNNLLDLAICQKIVQRHGGKLSVKPSKDNGNTYRIIFAKPVHILLVEDSEGDILLTTEVLQESKLNNFVSIVRNGEEAIHYLEKGCPGQISTYPDLVLLDVNLPKKNGHEVLDHLKNNPKTSDLPVIIISTSPYENDQPISMQKLAEGYIVKPVEVEIFDEIVSKLKVHWANHIYNITDIN